MIRRTRVFGIALMTAGAILALTWLIEPLRFLWPWFRALPAIIRIGLGAAAAGLGLLLGSLIWERLDSRDHDRSLLIDADLEREPQRENV